MVYVCGGDGALAWNLRCQLARLGWRVVNCARDADLVVCFMSGCESAVELPARLFPFYAKLLLIAKNDASTTELATLKLVGADQGVAVMPFTDSAVKITEAVGQLLAVNAVVGELG